MDKSQKTKCRTIILSHAASCAAKCSSFKEVNVINREMTMTIFSMCRSLAPVFGVNITEQDAKSMTDDVMNQVKFSDGLGICPCIQIALPFRSLFSRLLSPFLRNPVEAKIEEAGRILVAKLEQMAEDHSRDNHLTEKADPNCL